MSLDWTNAQLPPWAVVLWAQDNTRIALAMLVVAGALLLWRAPKRSSEKNTKQLPTEGRHVLWGLFARHERSVRVGGCKLDIAWRHIGIVGTSGSRKSTLLALLLEQIAKTYVCITGDHAPPLLNLTRSKGYRVWTPRGELAWYPWGGDLELAVQRVEHMFPASGMDMGVHRSMFKQAARKAWARVDERSRTVQQVMAAFPEVVTGSSGKSMAENWTARLTELIDSLGGSLATATNGGFDLVECVQRGESVMFALNSFADVSNRERFAKIAILETLRAADSVGNLSVAMDEVGLIGAELFSESVRVLRVRLCTGLFASHIADDFPKVLRGLVNVWFLGQVPGSDKATRDWMSQTTFGLVPPEHFGEHALKLGRFYLVANGRVQKLTVPTWKTRPVPGVQAVSSGRIKVSVEPGEPGERDEAPEWVRRDAQLENIWRNVEVIRGHRLSRYAVNNRGRPLCKYQGEQWLPYALMLAVAEGRDLREVRHRMADRSPTGLSVDHLCREIDPTCTEAEERRCQEISHLTWQTNGGNRRVQWERQRRRMEAVA